MPGFFPRPSDRRRVSGEAGASINQRPGMLIDINAQIAPTSTMLPCRLHVRYGAFSMIKDIIVNLEHRIGRDPARDFAISIAETFDSHIVGVTFAYAPDFPGYETLAIPPDIVAAMIAESEKAALAAIERFEEAARRSLVSAEH